MKNISTLLTALLLFQLASLPAAELRVVNGDFSDLTGPTSGDAHGWHGGVPAGWESSYEPAGGTIITREVPASLAMPPYTSVFVVE